MSLNSSGKNIRKNIPTKLNKNATPEPIPIRVNILRFQVIDL
jgi:hypothetical protein